MEVDDPAPTEVDRSAEKLNSMPKAAVDTSLKNPVKWGNTGHALDNEILCPGDLDVEQAYASPLSSDPKVEEIVQSCAASTRSGGSFETAQETLVEDDVISEGPTTHESDHQADHVAESGSGITELDAEEARDTAARALASIPEEEQPAFTPTTPLPPLIQEPALSAPQIPSPPSSLPTSPQRQARLPFRSPLWRTLIPVTPPQGGYWTPSSTREGEKNTPMCPPCRTGKKGRCFGGLPCDRCREKGYSRERCEGSLVFRFSPKTKRGGGEGKEKEKAIKSPSDGGRWKRDAYGRFV